MEGRAVVEETRLKAREPNPEADPCKRAQGSGNHRSKYPDFVPFREVLKEIAYLILSRTVDFLSVFSGFNAIFDRPAIYIFIT